MASREMVHFKSNIYLCNTKQIQIKYLHVPLKKLSLLLGTDVM